MRRFWKRRNEFADLESDIRDGRPEPQDAVVKAAAARVRQGPQWLSLRTRFSLAAALTMLALGLTAVFGGVGFAAYGVQKATNVVKVVKSVKTRIATPSAPRVVTRSPSGDQYHPHCGHPPNPPCHGHGSASHAVVNEGTSVTFTVSIEDGMASDGSARVDYATSNGTARAGVHYVATSGTLTIPSGATSASFSVRTINSAPHGQGQRTFSINLSNSHFMTVSGGGAVITINT